MSKPSKSQGKARAWREEREDEDGIDDRLADGFDLLAEDDPIDLMPPEVTGAPDRQEPNY